MDTEANKRAFNHALTKQTIPKVGSLIDFHFGIAVVAHWEWSYPNEVRTWLTRALAEAGEDNVLEFYDEKHKDPFFPAFPGDPCGLAIKLHTTEGLKWVLLGHPNYNRVGTLMGLSVWCEDYQPTFTDAVEVA